LATRISQTGKEKASNNGSEWFKLKERLQTRLTLFFCIADIELLGFPSKLSKASKSWVANTALIGDPVCFS